MTDQAITFLATFNKATTLVDGGWRISLDLAEHESDKITQLAKAKDQVLQVAIIPQENESFYG